MCNWISIWNCISICICICGWETGRVKVCLCTPAQSCEKCGLLGRGHFVCQPFFYSWRAVCRAGPTPSWVGSNHGRILYLCLCNCICVCVQIQNANASTKIATELFVGWGLDPAGWAQLVASILYFVSVYMYKYKIQIQKKSSWLGVFGAGPPAAGWAQPPNLYYYLYLCIFTNTKTKIAG